MPADDAPAPIRAPAGGEDEMNSTKVPDGGVLYDETEDDEDDILPVETAVLTTPVDWNEGWKNESGLKGADLIAEFVSIFRTHPASTVCSTRPAT
jgi:hypothetical protein